MPDAQVTGTGDQAPVRPFPCQASLNQQLRQPWRLPADEMFPVIILPNDARLHVLASGNPHTCYKGLMPARSMKMVPIPL